MSGQTIIRGLKLKKVMTKVQNSQVKQYTEINGVVLSPESIGELKYFQENGNEPLNRSVGYLADFICWAEMVINYEISVNPNLVDEGREHIMKIIPLRDGLKKLAKP